MEYAAIVHHATKSFCFALEKGRFLIRMQAKKGDLRQVILHMQEKYIPVTFLDTRKSVPMLSVVSDMYREYFEAAIDINVVCLRYYFELIDINGKRCFYGNYRFFDEPITNIDYMFDCPQTLREEECFQIPEWAKNSCAYQIFPSRFATDQNISVNQWYQAPISADTDLKGNLRGIINHLDHLKELGVGILYMTPIFEARSTHKYNTRDYYKIDPDFGTKDDLKELVEKAHSMGMRVVLDGVFNHTSQEFFAFEDIKKNGKASPYWDWYYIEDFPLETNWRKKPNFKCFSYFHGMPKLNLKNPQAREYVADVACYWIRECGIDGWRMDVADEIGHDFWKYFRKRVRAEREDILIVGEIWHFAGDFLEGDEWDSVMNYSFYNAVRDYVALETMSATQFIGELGMIRGNSNLNSFEALFNLIGSHDTPRFLHLCKENINKMKLAAAFQLLLHGTAMIYYGDEYGMSGGDDPDCRRGMLWDPSRQNQELYQWYKKLMKIRKEEYRLLKEITLSITADDKKDLVIFERVSSTLLFHRGEEPVYYDRYHGYKNLITGERFDGNIGPYEVAVLIG